MKNVLKVLFWIIALILFPIAAGLYFIWPSRIFKDRMSQNWEAFWWIIYAVQAFICVSSKVLICLSFLLIGYKDNGRPWISRDDVSAPSYKTSEDFYKLTGVEFPELEMVDSLYFEDGGFPTNMWREYKFVAKDGLSAGFYKRLERACITDSPHWHYTEGSPYDYFYEIVGEPTIGDRMHYHYVIYPDQEPVDRSRGMCDRTIKRDDGRMAEDWNGSFVTVDIVNDTIILRDGWLH